MTRVLIGHEIEGNTDCLRIVIVFLVTYAS